MYHTVVWQGHTTVTYDQAKTQWDCRMMQDTKIGFLTQKLSVNVELKKMEELIDGKQLADPLHEVC